MERAREDPRRSRDERTRWDAPSSAVRTTLATTLLFLAFLLVPLIVSVPIVQAVAELDGVLPRVDWQRFTCSAGWRATPSARGDRRVRARSKTSRSSRQRGFCRRVQDDSDHGLGGAGNEQAYLGDDATGCSTDPGFDYVTGPRFPRAGRVAGAADASAARAWEQPAGARLRRRPSSGFVDQLRGARNRARDHADDRSSRRLDPTERVVRAAWRAPTWICTTRRYRRVA